MNNQVNLSNLKQMDHEEVETIKVLVSALFGEFDPRVEIEGVYFGERRYPHTAYSSVDDRFSLAICLPEHQAENRLARFAHLSHELVHCLNPNGLPSQATILEEGLAEHSKIYLSRKHFQDQYPNYDFCQMSSGKYLDAFNKIEDLILFEGLAGMRDGIMKLRKDTKLPFCRITKDDLAVCFEQTPKSLLEEVSQPFESGP